MILRVLAVGDVFSESGLSYLSRTLRGVKRQESIDFVVVNGENVSGVGLTPAQARALLAAGAVVGTWGTHTWARRQLTHFLFDNPYILRPANYPARLPGRGYGVFPGPMGLRIGVVNLLGRVEMDPNVDNPFTTADRILGELEADVVLVDFHAEATSEKLALGWYLDGRVSAVWGTHTHVPTADGKVLPRGTGHITDLGMTGPVQSILGVKPDISVNKFLGGLPRRFESAEGPCKMDCVLFTIDTETRACTQVRRLDQTE